MAKIVGPQSDRRQNAAGQEYRTLPGVDSLLRLSAIAALANQFGQAEVTAAIRSELEQARQAIGAGRPAPAADSWPRRIEERLRGRQQPSLCPVINAAGVIVHTNLGRAPLSHDARRAVNQVGAAYSNLEYELDAGKRGSRHDHVRNLLCDLTGGEDALAVNNNAAAVFFILTVLCTGKEVLVSRGQLVEIGGGFRIPDVLRQSGCNLVEVGTTNRTHLRDFTDSVTPDTVAVMRIHSSNFQQIGFVSQPALTEIANAVKRCTRESDQSVLLIDDLGSGTLLDASVYGLAPEPTVQQSLAAGADIVTFSGDKLLGGPQAGIIIGRAELIARLRRHPMARALRVDKMTLAALDATLRSYQRGRAEAEVPVWMMISATLDALRTRAKLWQQELNVNGIAAELIEGDSAVGGGSLPGEVLPTILLSLQAESPDSVAAKLRTRALPVVCRIQRDRLLFDPRTVLPDQDRALVAALKEIF